MNQETFTLYLPCEIYEVRALVGPSANLTELEQLVLEAIDEGVQYLYGLKEFFGLGQRAMLDLLLDLWHGGHIEIDPTSSQIQLTSATRRYRREEKLAELRRSHSETQLLRGMRELVCGHFLSVSGESSPPYSVCAPEAPHLLRGAIAEDRRTELMIVLNRHVKPTVEGQPQRMLGMQLPLPDHAGQVIPTDSIFLPVIARVRRHPESGDLLFHILHPPDIPPRVRQAIGRQLSLMSQEMSDEIFFKQLQEKVVEPGEREDDLDVLLRRLREGTEKLDAAGLPSLRELHERCAATAEETLTLLHDYLARRAAVEILRGTEPIEWAIREAIETAEKQVVLVCPYTHVDGYQRFRDALAQTLQSRSIRVFVLWGMDDGAKIDGAFARGFHDLAQLAHRLRGGAARGGLYVSPYPARTHAKLVVKDADWALVGSWNFFSRRSQEMAEVAAVYQSTDGTPSSAALDLLRWVQEIYPEAVGRGQIWASASDFSNPLARATADRAVVAADASGSEPVPLSIPHAPPPVDGAVTPERVADVEIWRREWKQFQSVLERGRHTSGIVCRRVVNEEHRTLLWQAIKAAQHRLVITSDQITDDVVNERFTHLMRNRLAGGELRVTLVYHRRPDAALQELERLQDHVGDALQIVQGSNHSKLLVWDDEAVVSSFNFLSFQGVYDGSGRRRLRSELGVRLTGPGVADDVLHALVDQLPELRRVWRNLFPTDFSTSEEGAAPSLAGQEPPGLGRIREMLVQLHAAGEDAIARREAIRAFLEPLDKSRPDAWEALHILESKLPAADLEIGAACCLVNSAAAPIEERTYWLRFLAERAWWRGELFPAAAMITALGEARGSGLPTRRIAELAALHISADAFDTRLAALEDADGWDEDEERCAQLLALLALADRASTAAGTFLLSRPPPPASALSEVHAEFTRFWQQFGTPLPLGQLRTWESWHADRRRADAFRHALLAAWDRAVALNLDFESGRLTRERLLGDSGLMKPLQVAGTADDPELARRWLAEYGDENTRRLDALIDEATDLGTEGTPSAGQYIETSRRRGLQDRLGQVIHTAREWTDAVSPPPPGMEGFVIEAALGMGTRLRMAAARLVAESASPAGARPSTALAESLLQAITPLLQIAHTAPADGNPG